MDNIIVVDGHVRVFPNIDTRALVHIDDLPAAIFLGGDLKLPKGSILIGDIGLAFAVEFKGGIVTNITSVVNGLKCPSSTARGGGLAAVVQVAVILALVGNADLIAIDCQ